MRSDVYIIDYYLKENPVTLKKSLSNLLFESLRIIVEPEICQTLHKLIFKLRTYVDSHLRYILRLLILLFSLRENRTRCKLDVCRARLNSKQRFATIYAHATHDDLLFGCVAVHPWKNRNSNFLTRHGQLAVYTAPFGRARPIGRVKFQHCIE